MGRKTRFGVNRAGRLLAATALAVGAVVAVQVAPPAGDGGSVLATAPDCTDTEPTLVDGKYVIDTPGKLLHVANNTKVGNDSLVDASLVQTANLDIAGCGNWPGIGDPEARSGSPRAPFAGIYDGGGFSITGLEIAEDDRRGLFNRAVGATLSRISLIDVSVSAGSNVGALTGEASGGTTITDISVTGNVSGVNSVGGLVGFVNTSTISGSSVAGSVVGSGQAAGGLVGSAFTVTVVESSFDGNVLGREFVGGLVGSPGSSSSISASYAKGQVTAEKDAGGLTGYIVTSELRNSYADVTVSVTASTTGSGAGGLAGFAAELTMTNSFSIGPVSSTPDLRVGGLVGFVASGAPLTVTASFWDVTTSGQTTSAGTGGVGLGTEAMKMVATYTTAPADWRIITDQSAFVAGTSVWGICSARNNGYPYLLWEYTSAGDSNCPYRPASAGNGDGDTGTGTGDTGNGNTGTGVVDPVTEPTPTPTTDPEPTPEPATPTPVQVNGALPQMAPGEVVVYEDGVPVSVQVFVEDDTELVVEASTFELRLAGECDFGCTLEETDDGRYVLVLEQDGASRVDGEGFQPGSVVDVWLFSTPQYLGQLTVGADGSFSGTVDLAGVELGEHTLQVNGVTATGGQRSANMGVLVNSTEAPTLPATGGDVAAVQWFLLLVAIGGLLVLSARRTRRV